MLLVIPPKSAPGAFLSFKRRLGLSVAHVTLMRYKRKPRLWCRNDVRVEYRCDPFAGTRQYRSRRIKRGRVENCTCYASRDKDPLSQSGSYFLLVILRRSTGKS